ncbi:DnaJ domain-containing protein [Colletotrichum falcatum]|nr:DnaJ domain-containing protein [Colletotrichum falcatum]
MSFGVLYKWANASQMLFRSHRRYSHSHGQRPGSSSVSQLHERTLWPHTSCPSPHDILGAKPGRPYSKKQFHRLVKLYHPDLHYLNEGILDALPRATRNERYRLVVEANEILSNQQKRLLYETYGMGWIFPKQETASDSCHSTGAYGTNDDQPFGEAGSRQQIPLFASNATIAIIIVAIAMAGAIVQLERTRRAQWDFKTRDKAIQDSITRDLRELAGQLDGKPRDMRIMEFLARRELGRWKTGEATILGFDPGENICRH